MIRNYPGWVGLHTRAEAPDAMRNGTRVRKATNEPGDTHRIGALATVLGSIYMQEHGYAYFVAWDDTPRTATLVIEAKLARSHDATQEGSNG